jgi:Xaa-Pro aminopeptidase
MIAAVEEEKASPRIPDAEFANRIARLQAKMAGQSMDLVVCYSNALDPGHVRYLADVVGINESAAVVVPVDGAPIVCVGQACQAWGRHKSRHHDVRIVLEVGEVAGTEYQVGDQFKFSQLLKGLAPNKPLKKVGIAGRLTFPQVLYKQLQESFPNAEIVDAEPTLFELRVVKSEAEIACVRRACEILDIAHSNVVSKVQPGWTELEIMAEIVRDILRNGAEDTAVSWLPMIPSGPVHSNLCMNRNSTRQVKEGEIICLQSGATYEGYNGALCSPLVLGAIPEEILSAVLAANDAMDAIVETLKPGATSAAANEAGRKVLETSGYAKYSPYAMVHNIGCLECESPWMPDDGEFRIVEGMTVCVDVFLFQLPWGSFRIENTLAIEPDGAELLTKFNQRYVRKHFA